MKAILITGGAGFIGQNLVKHFQKKHKIFIIDNLSSQGLFKKCLYNKKNVKLIKKDISNFSNILNSLKNNKIEIVIHAAAHFANENSIINPERDLKTNILGTLNILEYCRKKKIKKLIYLSSSCVYGDKNLTKENVTVDPNETPYAISKYSGEQYVKFYKNYYGLNSVIVRVFNTYGPGEISHRFRNVIPRFIDFALKNKNIVITGTGNETRDFTFVEDLVKFIEKLINLKNIPKIINVCTGKKTSINVLAKLIINLTKSQSKISYKPIRRWDKVKNRLGSVLKIKKYINTKKFVNLETGLKKTIQWYKNK